MPNGERRDPLISAYFTVEFQGVIVGAFQEVSGLGSQNEVVEYKASGPKGEYVIHKVPGRLSWNNITLKRGITAEAMDLWEWRALVEQGKVEEARKNGSVVMYDQNGNEVARWNFVNAWPSSLTGPSANASANETAIEELEIVVEGYERVK
jgi:phage tail-like protein